MELYNKRKNKKKVSISTGLGLFERYDSNQDNHQRGIKSKKNYYNDNYNLVLSAPLTEISIIFSKGNFIFHAHLPYQQ